jgi:hypothetical protein
VNAPEVTAIPVYRKLQEWLNALPHLRGRVEATLVPTINSPAGVLEFDWPDSRPEATGGIKAVSYNYFFDIYLSVEDASDAMQMLLEILVALRAKVDNDPQLEGLADNVILGNGGRAFSVGTNLVKPMVITVFTEEGSEYGG